MLLGPIIIFRHISDDNVALSHVSVVMQIIFFGTLFLDAIPSAALPVLSKFFKNKDDTEKTFTPILLNLGLMGFTLFSLFIMSFGELIIKLFLGVDYSEMVNILGVSMWGMIPLMMMYFAMPHYIIRKYNMMMAYYIFRGAIIMTIMLPFLISDLGAMGAIVCALVGYIISAASLIFTALRAEFIIWENIKKPMLSVALSLLVYFQAIDKLGIEKSFFMASLVMLPFMVSFLLDLKNAKKKR